MSDDESARWALPLLQPGQAQKEMTHNEALTTIDLIVHPMAVAILDTPPVTPESGQSWIVGGDPVGAWAGKDGQLAGWSGGGWRFAVPVEGMTVWVDADGLVARFLGGAWVLGEEAVARLTIDGAQVLGARQPPIADPSGGSVVDVESRAALATLLATLRTHGLIEN